MQRQVIPAKKSLEMPSLSRLYTKHQHVEEPRRVLAYPKSEHVQLDVTTF